MNTINVITRTRFWIALFAGILFIAESTTAAEPTEKLRIGTYDSRCVALAFWHEDNFKNIFYNNRSKGDNLSLWIRDTLNLY